MKNNKRTKPSNKEDEDEDTIWWWLAHKSIATSFIGISLFALLIRVAISIHPYSGAGKPPKYGDFEAQRHWMEITLSLPTSEWYHNSTFNDLSYWGLDYPPLTAYQSYFHGLFLRKFHPESVLLNTSRGHESYFGKLMMRWTVLSSDVMTFFPAVLYFIVAYYSGIHSRRKNKIDVLWHIAIILLNPCLILIDHGHFQYNCISLGLAVGAVAAILSDKDLVACFLFSLALNHKQMSAYFAPAFFAHLLGKSLRHRNPVIEVLKLGFVVLVTFALVWWPYLHSLDSFFEVLSRLAPFERGLYEDYVANFWCTSSILVKWKRLFTIQFLKKISLGATIVTFLPSMVQQIWAPSKQGFLYGLLNSSLAFYLFSYQVHEKSILLPLVPASLLAMEEPFLFKWMIHFAMLSMFPLLVRDELILAYFSLYILYSLVYHTSARRSEKKKATKSTSQLVLIAFLFSSSIVLHLVYLFMTPPEKYPFIFEAVIMLLCFSQFVLIVGYTNVKQWALAKENKTLQSAKKNL